MSLDEVTAAIEDFRDGKMVIVIDEEDRENEGDLTIAAEKVTPEVINFMAKYGRGLICMPMTGERLRELNIPLMVSRISGWNSISTPATSATQSRVISSAVGPSPPEQKTTSDRSSASFSAALMRSGLSPTVVF